jgi:hemerythrin-like domain-containing protein
VKCSTNPKAIEYLASIGMADTVSKYIAELEAENARLKAEVERLTKAGDAMANNIPYYADVDISAETLRQFTDKWHAAKENPPHA